MKKIVFFLSLMVFSSIAVLGQYTINGSVLYHQNPEYPIEGAEISLFADGQFVASTISDENGIYSFEDLGYGTFTLQTSINLPGANVTVQEAIYILLYLNGLYELSTVQFMAADVDANGLVNHADFLFIVRNHWVFGQPFPAGSWAFEEIEVNTGTREGGPSNIGGTKIGDVEGVFVPTGRDLINEYQISEIGSFDVQTGNEIVLPIYVSTPNNSISGYGIVLDFDPEVIEVLEVNALGENAFTNIGERFVRIGNLTTNMGAFENYDGLMAQVRVRIKKNEFSGFLPFKIGSESHIIDQKGQKELEVDFGMPSLKPISTSLLQENQIFPNPAISQLSASVYSELAGSADMIFVDQSGRIVKTEKIQLKAGIFDYEISLGDLRSGVYQVILRENTFNKVLLSQRLVKI
jgi:hypothetical protein